MKSLVCSIIITTNLKQLINNIPTVHNLQCDNKWKYKIICCELISLLRNLMSK